MFVNWLTLSFCDLEKASQVFPANSVFLFVFLRADHYFLNKKYLCFFKEYEFKRTYAVLLSALCFCSCHLRGLCDSSAWHYKKWHEVWVRVFLLSLPLREVAICPASTVVDLVLNEPSEGFLSLSRFQFPRKTCWPSWHYFLGLLSFVETWGLNLF